MSRHVFRVPMLLSMSPLHLLGNNDQNEVKYDSVYVIPLEPELASLHANGIRNDIISFLRSRQLK